MFERAPRLDGYLQHAALPAGPFRTERVAVHHQGADRYRALFEGRWRTVHVQMKRLYITYQGERITIQIDGV